MQEIGIAFKSRPKIGQVEQKILNELGDRTIKFISQVSQALLIAAEVYQNDTRPLPRGLLERLDLAAQNMEDAALTLRLDSTLKHIKHDLGIRERIPEGDE